MRGIKEGSDADDPTSRTTLYIHYCKLTTRSVQRCGTLTSQKVSMVFLLDMTCVFGVNACGVAMPPALRSSGPGKL
ncbi:uncharacterized protein CC84DRAFT_970467 [Paraphaeosphaeria sporulosa]|uniref:Uncharacterized protein n=1 Tax=Paraphaeosphaeria sporulosa TaxID=1460663 RepID=A0A177C891_9PLEO|nr:uncharacterized protein CC84DRAFT_970467 [Paraphaeosphaeria sporulosa]OAG03351.1 hypothetical protein CC84DRAFT_970467 [Paraphaeosphaeria sporulosa]